MTQQESRGHWGSKSGFIFAAAGSAVGLGNIWGFPTQVASNGGAAFLIIYLLCCFLVGYPLIIAELSIGRHTGRNPVGAFRAMKGNSRLFLLIGFWCVFCGVMILSYYNVIAGWTFSYVLGEISFFGDLPSLADYFGDTGNGVKNTIFSVIFMALTVSVIIGGVSSGIERASKFMMPILIGIMLVLIVYVFTLEGSSEGLSEYLIPDFSSISAALVFSAMGQAFFSLSLGMGTLITYGSYISKHQNIPEAAAYVTLLDFSIAFVAGLLIVPAMDVALANDIEIFSHSGALLNENSLVFSVLPEFFHLLGGTAGFLCSVFFFALLSLAALTSTISLLEVPVSYVIDEHGLQRSKAALLVGGCVLLISTAISFDTSLISVIATIFNNIGLPFGGLMICIILGYLWKTETILIEVSEGYEGFHRHKFGSLWVVFIKYICPVLIAIVFISTILSLL